MKIKDLSIGSARVKVEGKVVNKSEPKTVKLWDGRDANVADAVLEDESGSIILTLWNDQIDMVNVGDKVQIINGYVSNFKKEKRLNLGRYGKIIKV
ncbi:MAG: OB-fold nucleic acid binding domain-containing protein [Nitrososphaeria archaeon]|nr:DNA-binding protein [Nitrososphaerota archaeon]